MSAEREVFERAARAEEILLDAARKQTPEGTPARVEAEAAARSLAHEHRIHLTDAETPGYFEILEDD